MKSRANLNPKRATGAVDVSEGYGLLQKPSCEHKGFLAEVEGRVVRCLVYPVLY